MAKKEAEDFLWVETCLESSLGEALKKAEHQKLNCIILDGTRVWREAHVSGFGKRNDLYWKIDGMFVFDPEYAPTKKLIEVLKEAGFNVKLETEFEQNYTYVTSADGYDVVDAPGHHPVHYLEIGW